MQNYSQVHTVITEQLTKKLSYNCDAINVDSLFASSCHSELSEVFDLLSDDLDATFIRGVELQHPLPVQLWTGGETAEGDEIQEGNKEK